MKKHIGIVLFDNFDLLDIAGPSEVFTVADELGIDKYYVTLIGNTKRAYQSESGIQVVATESLNTNIYFDTLIIPGGKGARDFQVTTTLRPWLISQIKQCRRVISVCTGSFLLASTGILDGKKATTHWNYIQEFRTLYPHVEVVEDKLFVNQDNIATSAGISSGIDLALSLVESDFGGELALKVSRYLVLHYRRTGNQTQYSEPLEYQFSPDNDFSHLTSWIIQNLTKDLSVARLADQFNMTERSFFRKFSQQMNTSPSKYVELLRLEHAKSLLADSQQPIVKISHACGYKNTDVFRRAFERKYSISPSTYRNRFTSQQEKPVSK